MSERDVFGKPINVPKLADRAMSRELLEYAGQVTVEAIQNEIRRASFKGVPVDLIRSFEYKIENDQLVISSDHPAAAYLDRGVKPYQMSHLTKVRKPIPIITDSGEVVFRSATEASMRSGGWRHPGIEGKDFIQRGVAKAQEEIKKKAVEQTKRQIKARFSKILKKLG
jgi:hypothetical protein